MVRAIILICLVLLPHAVRADRLFLPNGDQMEVHVDHFAVDNASAVFTYRIWQGTELSRETHAITPRELLRIEFRDPADLAPVPAGRAGHLSLANGEEYLNATLHQINWQDQQCLLAATLAIGQDQTSIDARRIASLTLAPPLGAPNEPIADPTDPSNWDFTEEELDFQYQDPFKRPPPPAPANEFERIVQDSEEGFSSADPLDVSGDPGNQTVFEALQIYSTKIGIKAIALAMILGFLLGGMMLRFSAKSCGIDDVSKPRLMACAALLSFIPPTLFFTAFWLFPLYIGLKLFTGLAVFYLSARMIVMGMVEVLESKATEILLLFYGVWLVLLIAITKIL